MGVKNAALHHSENEMRERGEALLARLPWTATVVLDTAPVIYLLEDNRAFLPLFWPLLQAAESGRVRILITPITVAEVLAGPWKAGKEALAERYEHALREGLGWKVVDLDAGMAARASRLRGRYGLRLPDAFQLAACLGNGADALVTHDRDFGKAAKEVCILGA
ncbi:MAG: tRNA(fMet)-specific endonuclease VapC [Fibrobacterota bacterium]|jgi:predicted nucleic acid-binding protein